MSAPAHKLPYLSGDALKRHGNKAFERLVKAEESARLVVNEPQQIQDEIACEQLDAIALCEEFGWIGSEV